MTKTFQSIDPKKIEVSIKMIKSYVNDVDTTALIEVLKAMMETPEDTSLITQMSDALQPLGIGQGAVLSYAPYLSGLLLNNIDEMGLDD